MSTTKDADVPHAFSLSQAVDMLRRREYRIAEPSSTGAVSDMLPVVALCVRRNGVSWGSVQVDRCFGWQPHDTPPLHARR